MRGLPGKIALLLAGVAAGLLLAEAALRWVLPARYAYIHPEFEILSVEPAERENQMAGSMLGAALQYVPEPWAYRLKRNLRARFRSSEFDVDFRTNGLGLRGPDLGAKQGRRVLGLGDSFAMGFGVEYAETYLTVLRDLFGEHGEEVQTVNAGVVGYNLHNSYQYLAGAGVELAPDVVVLQIWVDDDLPVYPGPFRPLEKEASSWSLRGKRWVRHAHLAMFARDRLRGIDRLRGWLLREGLIEPFAADRHLRADLPQRWGKGGVGRLASLLEKFQQLCRRRDIRLVVLLVPMKEQVNERFWRRALAYDGVELRADEVDFEAPNRIVRKIAGQRRMELVDLLDLFREKSDTVDIYFDNDPHLTAAGHQLAGEALFEHLGGR